VEKKVDNCVHALRQAPGATASLLLGAGEFQPYFQRNLDIAKSLERILQVFVAHSGDILSVLARGCRKPHQKMSATIIVHEH
jgi:hypothetical protein